MLYTYKTASRAATKKFAKKILASLKRRGPSDNAVVFALSGDLGSGKTTFVQGFLGALGVRPKITSPTFVLIKRYKIKNLKFKNVYHIDCYRIKKPRELLKLGLREILADPQNVVLIEWAEKIEKALPKNSIWIKFEHGKKENQRTIRIFV